MSGEHLEGGREVIEQSGRVCEDVLEVGTFLLPVDRERGCGFLRLYGASMDGRHFGQLV